MTPWTVLALPADCTEKDLKRRYAQLIRQHRPESDPEGFARVRAAYELVLAHLRFHAAPPDGPVTGRTPPAPVAPLAPAATPLAPKNDAADVSVLPPSVAAPLQGWTGDERSAALQRAIDELTQWFESGSRGAWWTDRPAPLGHVMLLANKLDMWDYPRFLQEGLALYLRHGLKAPQRAAQWGQCLSAPGSPIESAWRMNTRFHEQVADLCFWINVWTDGLLAQATSPWQAAGSRDYQRPWFCAEDDLAWPLALTAMADERLKLRGVTEVPPPPAWLQALRQGPRILHSEWAGALIAAMACQPMFWLALTRGPHQRDPEAVAAAAPWPTVIAVTLGLTLLLTLCLSGLRELRWRERLRPAHGLGGKLRRFILQGTQPQIWGSGALRWLASACVLGVVLWLPAWQTGLQDMDDPTLWIARVVVAGCCQALLHLLLAASEVPAQLEAARRRLLPQGALGAG